MAQLYFDTQKSHQPAYSFFRL